MFKLSAEANKQEYADNMGKTVLFGKKEVVVIFYEKDGRSGSYERGFKFTNTKYGGLRDGQKVSFDHGVTWLGCRDEYYFYVFHETKKGRVRLASKSNKEFAFDDIQKINKEYYGPGYSWKP